MSKYTTGEIAKLYGVSVRTVQYYDSRSILVPSKLSEGGRRLYSEDDLKRLRVICFLREAGIPINKIHELFTEEHPEKVISILLDQQGRELREAIAEEKKKLSIVETIKRELKEIPNSSVGGAQNLFVLIQHNLFQPAGRTCHYYDASVFSTFGINTGCQHTAHVKTRLIFPLAYSQKIDMDWDNAEVLKQELDAVPKWMPDRFLFPTHPKKPCAGTNKRCYPFPEFLLPLSAPFPGAEKSVVLW